MWCAEWNSRQVIVSRLSKYLSAVGVYYSNQSGLTDTTVVQKICSEDEDVVFGVYLYVCEHDQLKVSDTLIYLLLP